MHATFYPFVHSSGVIRLGELMTEERLVIFLTAFEDSQDSRRPGLSYSNFTSLFSCTMGISENSQSIQVLCKKVRVIYTDFQSIFLALLLVD